jgi:D-alanyl-D-alanine carboxypeptidase
MKREPPAGASAERIHALASRVIWWACIFSLTVLFTATCHAFSQVPATPAGGDLAAGMDKVAADVYRPGVPGAAVIVVRDGRVIFRKGYGLANLELNIPVKPEMVFRLASVTKQFTAVAVMMLVEQGRLSLQDDITKFFPGYPTGGRRITVENLLTHTSGIKDYTGKLWPARMREDLRVERLIDVFKDDGLEFEPGTKQSYSNSNYILLGAIIERLSGKEYRRFIEENIFRPLGMRHSYYEGAQELIPGRVSGYLKAEGTFYNAPYLSTTQLYAAGALCSSVDDLALWDAAVYSDKLLRRDSWERVFTPYKFAGGEPSDYAFGWAISKFEGRTIASHTGGIPGFTDYVLHMPEGRVYVAILSNDRTAEVQPEYVARRLAAIAIGKPMTDPKVVRLAPRRLDEYVGRYQGGDGEMTTVRRDGDRLFSQSAGDPEVELFPTSDETFVIKAFDARVSFVKDERGEVAGMVVRVGDQSYNLRKIR